MNDVERVGRRASAKGLAAACGLVWLGCSAPSESANGDELGRDDEPEVTPAEDLMREHGLLQRVLLVYQEAGRRLVVGEPLDVTIVARAADIVRVFVEDYHERIEERFVFPALERAGRETELVRVLRRQHERGRETTAAIASICGEHAGTVDPARLAPLLAAFERMYRPHAAHEDTIVFPAFRTVVGVAAYRELGEQFEDEEHSRFGPHGFEDNLAQVAQLETALQIGDIERFTP